MRRLRLETEREFRSQIGLAIYDGQTAMLFLTPYEVEEFLGEIDILRAQLGKYRVVLSEVALNLAQIEAVTRDRNLEQIANEVRDYRRELSAILAWKE